ncbi:MAG TPA: alpha/beta hydrolase family protein [Pyrinomonadaceae bacterium]|nr:alpha/beta hydrolase family protein [Pyrinomonadaceae bacterium]
MTRHSRAFILLAVGFALTVSAQQSTTPHPSAASVAQATAPKQHPRVQTVQFESKLVGKTLPYNVLLPVDYDQEASKTKRYPVVYLLHGLTGHYTNWLDKTKLTDHAAPYGLIIVTPEGNDSWYSDSVTVPSEKYETYIINELLPDVQRRYRTIESREGRAIAGLSMGGYGALKFGVKYPHVFTFAGSMSGALDAASWTEADLRGLQFIWRTLQPVFGPVESPGRAANDLQKLVRELSVEKIDALPYVYLDCGTEDVLLQSNRNFVEILMQRKIKHEYRQLPGAHNWIYWNAQVQEVLKLAAIKLNACNC